MVDEMVDGKMVLAAERYNCMFSFLLWYQKYKEFFFKNKIAFVVIKELVSIDLITLV